MESRWTGCWPTRAWSGTDHCQGTPVAEHGWACIAGVCCMPVAHVWCCVVCVCDMDRCILGSTRWFRQVGGFSNPLVSTGWWF